MIRSKTKHVDLDSKIEGASASWFLYAVEESIEGDVGPWQQTISEFEKDNEYLPNPIGRRRLTYPGIHYRDDLWGQANVWYHGTQSDFEGVPKYRGVKRLGGGWGSQLGVHFSSEPVTAQGFARGYVGKGRSDIEGRVLPARLRITHPKNYNLETDMWDHAFRVGIRNGILNIHDINRGANEIDRRIYAQLLEGIVPSTEDWGFGYGPSIIPFLGRKKPILARAFVKKLKEDGYDGITYYNASESPNAEAAIVFDPPSQIDLIQPGKSHIEYIMEALNNGLPVPERVLADYPSLLEAIRKGEFETPSTPERIANLDSALYQQLLALRPEIAQQVQKVYNEWEQDEEGIDEIYGSGGICDEISQIISNVIASNIDDVEITEGGQEGDDHAFTIAYRNDEVFVVDIPPSVYESGSGYVWKKRHDVNFEIDDIEIYDISGDFEPEYRT